LNHLDLVIDAQQVSQLIDISSKLNTPKQNGQKKKKKGTKTNEKECDYEINCKNIKYQEAMQFLIMLFQTSLDRMHHSKDVVCRVFLKLISNINLKS
jgi:hypothetical protein